MTLEPLLLLLTVGVSSISAQIPPTDNTNASSTIATAAASTTTAADNSVATITDAATPSPMHQANCSACISTFSSIYLNIDISNSSSISQSTDVNDCPSDVRQLNDSCVSFVRDNCTDILSLLFSVSSNTSFGLSCTNTGLRVFKWTYCQPGSDTAKLINESNTFFCRMRNFNCSADASGITSISKFDVLKPQAQHSGCTMPTTGPPTIPLLPNPVGPSAITAIVVLVCLFIVAVLAGFFFWPKCHVSKTPPTTPKKKAAPPTASFNVAYSGSSENTAAAAAAAAESIAVHPSQAAGRGPAAA